MKPADADDVLMMRAIKTNKKTNKNHQATTNLWARCVFMCVLLRRLVWRLRSDFHAHRPSGCNSAFLQYRAASTLSACHVRWAGDEATSPDVCGNSWNSRQLGECPRRFFFFFFWGDSPKTIGWLALFNCRVEYCNYKTVSQIRERIQAKQWIAG